MGVNAQSELVAAESQFQWGRRTALLESGVSMTAPETVFFSWDTKIEPGVVIEPNVVFGTGGDRGERGGDPSLLPSRRGRRCVPAP